MRRSCAGVKHGYYESAHANKERVIISWTFSLDTEVWNTGPGVQVKMIGRWLPAKDNCDLLIGTRSCAGHLVGFYNPWGEMWLFAPSWKQRVHPGRGMWVSDTGRA